MRIRRLEDQDFDWKVGSGGAEEVRRIAASAAAHDGGPVLNEAAFLTLQGQGLGTGLLLLAENPEPVGFGYVHGLSGPGRPELDLVVAPEARRRGVGTALMGAVEEALSGIPLTVWSHGNHPGAARLAARMGYKPVRELWLMRREAGRPLPQVKTPVGYRVRAFRPGVDDADFLALNAAAFADHPEQGALDQHGLEQRMGQDWFDPEGFLLAEDVDSGGLAGFHWTKRHLDEPGGPAYGEVYVIGVAPTAQGSGLGRHLLRAGLEHLRGRGVGEVVLYVEADNDPAIALYESFGFTHAPEDTDVMYLK